MVGSSFVNDARAKGYEIFSPNRQELNLNDFALKGCLSTIRPDFVIHAGRVGGIKANMAHPVDFLLENTTLGLNLIRACADSGVRNLINLGSSCMYPKDFATRLKEDMILAGPLEPTNEGYALAKILSMRLCDYYNQQSNGFLAYKTLIPCNLYGPRDKFEEEDAHLIPAVIRKMHSAVNLGSDKVEIWGDGTARREFLFVDDLVDAIFRALADFTSLPSLMNISATQDYTVLEYYKRVGAAFGFSGEFTFDLSKPVGMSRKFLDDDKQKAWGWAPRTSLNSGIKKTINWYLHSKVGEKNEF